MEIKISRKGKKGDVRISFEDEKTVTYDLTPETTRALRSALDAILSGRRKDQVLTGDLRRLHQRRKEPFSGSTTYGNEGKQGSPYG